jgi:hypothetical protein
MNVINVKRISRIDYFKAVETRQRSQFSFIRSVYFISSLTFSLRILMLSDMYTALEWSTTLIFFYKQQKHIATSKIYLMLLLLSLHLVVVLFVSLWTF